MTTVVFLSCDALSTDEQSRRHPLFVQDDEPLLDALAERGIDVEPVDWRMQPASALARRTVIVRTPWNYTAHGRAFRNWLSEAAGTDMTLINPAALMLETLDKRYLLDLERAGIDVVPTRVIAPGSPADCAHLGTVLGCQRLVFKPAVGAGARDTVVAASAQPALPEAIARRLTLGDTVLAQPFLPEIVESGEISAMFFGGHFGHAVVKTPAAGDFRVQAEWGGSTALTTLDPALQAQAAAVSAHYGDPAYCRVDGVVSDGRFRVMEVEMIEPELFFRYAPSSALLFADILARLAAT